MDVNKILAALEVLHPRSSPTDPYQVTGDELRAILDTDPILVIWENVPESLQLYSVTPKDAEDRAKILEACNNYINMSPGDELASWLNQRLMTTDEDGVTQLREGVVEVGDNTSELYPIEHHGTVIVSGFIM